MERIEKFLAERRRSGLFRVLRPVQSRKAGIITCNGRKFRDFSSNDYLALAGHPRLIEASIKATEKFGTGCSASRLLSGDFQIHHQLEEKTAAFKGKEAALVFNSGYQANVGIISALYKSSDAVFADKLSHASILDGISLSGARLLRFAHNDAGHLESLLKKNDGKFKNRLIVTETIFSMDGDRPPLGQLVELKERYGCELMIDEAHATGVFGADGSGVAAEDGLIERVDLIMGTFSKALGSFGAYLAGSKRIIDYLVNTARSFIYSTALPAGVIAANIAAMEVVERQPYRRQRLLENADYFRGGLCRRCLEVRGCSQIVPLIVGQAQRAVELSEFLLKKGFRVLAIRPPTVPSGQSRLRFSLTCHHSREILKELIEQIGQANNV